MPLINADSRETSRAEAFILAGGVSSRMGKAKGLLEISGVPMIMRTYQLVETLVSRTTVVGQPDIYQHLGLRMIPDQDFQNSSEEGRSNGPLLGIATALANSAASWNLILACDLPYLSRDWLKWLLDRAGQTNAQAIVPRTTRGLEPLAALYRKDCVTTISQSLARGVRKVTDALSDLNFETVNEVEWSHPDPDGIVLKNMNTSADYKEACNWWKSKTVR